MFVLPHNGQKDHQNADDWAVCTLLCPRIRFNTDALIKKADSARCLFVGPTMVLSIED